MMLRAQLKSMPLRIRLVIFLGPLLALIIGLSYEYRHLKKTFHDEVSLATHQIETKVNAFEVALEGFANFLAISEDISDKEIRAYTQGVRRIFPELYMFEIASYVDKEGREAFEEMMRWKGYSNFSIHGFDYKESRQVTQLGQQPFYYVIRFIDPESPMNDEVLGLDLASTSDVLINTMQRALKAPQPIASRPFRLLEGGKGYVIYRPAIATAEFKTYQDSGKSVDFAMLVIRGNDLLPQWLKQNTDYHVTLSYTHKDAEEITEILIDPSVSNVAFHMSSFEAIVPINSESQPFLLKLEKLICLSSLNWLTIAGFILTGGVVSLLLGMRLNKDHHLKLIENREKKKLYQQANFDSLTGLPNTNLLMDRAEQAILKAQRSERTVAICYLDIDGFKKINDSWGHEAGDKLLKDVAARLVKALRNVDTIARIHGDEFVVLLPELNNSSELEGIKAKILSVFSRPFTISSLSIKLSSSIGAASYPQDGENLEELLSKSDRRMYIHKHRLKEASGVEEVEY